jgi:drug/metabolite transporter (DMT)-like permease
MSWVYVSLISAFAAYWVWVMALRRFEASRLASVGNLVPLLVHLSSALFLAAERKAFTPYYIAGAALTLSGTTMVMRRRGKGAVRP